MSTTLSAGSAPQESQAATVGLLLLGVVLAALWIGVNLLFPGLAPTGIPSAVTRLAIHAAILAGLWLGLSRTDFSMSKRITIWLAITIPFTLWLAVVWALAVNGAFQPIPGVVRLPRLPIAIFAPVIIGLFFVLRSKSIAAFLDATPAPWLIALQVYRRHFSRQLDARDRSRSFRRAGRHRRCAHGNHGVAGSVVACVWKRARTKRRHGLEYLRAFGFCGCGNVGHSELPGAVPDLRPGYPGLARGHLPNGAHSGVRSPEFDPSACAFNPPTQADWATGGTARLTLQPSRPAAQKRLA